MAEGSQGPGPEGVKPPIDSITKTGTRISRRGLLRAGAAAGLATVATAVLGPEIAGAQTPTLTPPPEKRPSAVPPTFTASPTGPERRATDSAKLKTAVAEDAEQDSLDKAKTDATATRQPTIPATKTPVPPTAKPTLPPVEATAAADAIRLNALGKEQGQGKDIATKEAIGSATAEAKTATAEAKQEATAEARQAAARQESGNKDSSGGVSLVQLGEGALLAEEVFKGGIRKYLGEKIPGLKKLPLVGGIFGAAAATPAAPTAVTEESVVTEGEAVEPAGEDEDVAVPVTEEEFELGAEDNEPAAPAEPEVTPPLGAEDTGPVVEPPPPPVVPVGGDEVPPLGTEDAGPVAQVPPPAAPLPPD